MWICVKGRGKKAYIGMKLYWISVYFFFSFQFCFCFSILNFFHKQKHWGFVLLMWLDFIFLPFSMTNKTIISCYDPNNFPNHFLITPIQHFYDILFPIVEFSFYWLFSFLFPINLLFVKSSGRIMKVIIKCSYNVLHRFYFYIFLGHENL